METPPARFIKKQMDEDSLLSTPAGYATPAQVSAIREYAKALMQGAGQQPVHHWAEGLSNMVGALAGGRLLNRAGQQDLLGEKFRASQMPQSEAAGGQPANAGADPMASYSKGISSIESGGNYNEVGPTTRTGDRAYGKYQVMGANIPEWTQEILGKPMSPEEFLKSPEAQEAVFKGKFGQYVKKYGNPQDAASAWFTGRPLSQGANLHDQLGTTGQSYVDKFNAATGAAGGQPPGLSGPAFGQPLGFSGDPAQPTGQPQSAQDAIVMALSKGAIPQPVPGPNMAVGNRVAQNGAAPGQDLYPEGTVPHRIPVTRQQLMGSMLSGMPPEARQFVMQSYYTQHQPLTLDAPFGKVVVNPDNPAQRAYIPDKQTLNMEANGVKANVPYLVGPNNTANMVQFPGGGPTGGPQRPSQLEILEEQNRAKESAPKVPDKEAAAAPVEQPVIPPQEKTINGWPQPTSTGGALPYAEEGTGGPLATPPPGGGGGGGQKFAQAGVPSVPPVLQDLSNWGIHQKAKEEGAVEGAKEFTKGIMADYKDVTDRAKTAAQSLSDLSVAQRVMDTPGFYSGLASDPVLAFKQGLAALGLDQNAAQPMEVFRKLLQGNNLNDLRTTLGGLGQIRLAEINMINQANANLNVSPAANKFLLEYKKRAYERLLQANDLTQDYINAHGGNPPDAKWKQLLTHFYKDKPLFSDDELKNWQMLTAADATKNVGAKKAPVQGAVPPAPKGYRIEQ